MKCLFYLSILASASLTLASNQTSQLDKRKLECHYKGSVYREEETILIEEPCLSCTCHSGALVCSLRVCPDLPNPPPQGCIILHKKNQCCPQLICEDPGMHTIDLRTEGRPVLLNGSHGCLVNGSVFSEGSALSTSSLCEYCYCIKGQQRCIKPHCVMPVPGCRATYREYSCCPIHYDCSELHVSSISTFHVEGCEMDGSTYREGDMMPSSSPCEHCYCMSGKPTCGPIRCTIQHLEGCYPVYTNGQCCPTTYNCTNRFANTDQTFLSNKLRSIEIEDRHKSYQNKTSSASSTTTVEGLTTQPNLITEATHTTEKMLLTTDISGLTESPQTSESAISTTEPYKTTELSFGEETPVAVAEYDTTTGMAQDLSTVTDFTTEVFTEGTTILDTANVSEPFEESMSTTFSGMDGTTSTVSSVPTTLPAELNIITAPDDFYSVNLSSNMMFDGVNRSQSPVGVQERKQPAPLEGLPVNGSRGEEDYPSYDYEEPELPPSLPNLVIYPFLAADAVTKEEGGDASSKSDGDVGPVYYKNYFSPPKETEGGFVPKEDAVEESSGYEEKYFSSNEPDSSHDSNPSIPSITLPPNTLPEVTESNTERIVDMTVAHSRFPTLPPVTVADIIDVTPDPFRDVIRTEPAPDLPSLMSDILPYLIDQQTKKPVSVNYKNVVIDYYPSHFITTRREDERKTTMVIEKSPVYKATTEAINISSIELTSTSPVYRPKLPDDFYITTEYSPVKPLEGRLENQFEKGVTDESEIEATDAPAVRTSIRPIVSETTEPSRRVELKTEISVEVPEASTKLTNIVGLKPKPVRTTNKPTTEPDSFLNDFLKEFFESNTELPSSTTPPSRPHPKLGHKYSSKIRNPPFSTTTAPSVEVIENRGGEEENTSSFSLDSVLHMLFSSEENGGNGNNSTLKPIKSKNGTKYTRKPVSRKTKKPQPVTVPIISVTKPFELSTTERPITEKHLTTTERVVAATTTIMPFITTVVAQTSTSQDLLKTTIRGESSFVTDENTGFPKINILQQGIHKPSKVVSKIEDEGSENIVQHDSARKPAKLSGGLGSILKLAGCNIYGRMYRVGKIIAELSSPCLECMCTDSGVQCSQLVC